MDLMNGARCAVPRGEGGTGEDGTETGRGIEPGSGRSRVVHTCRESDELFFHVRGPYDDPS